ncbi:hypothetical protein [Halorubrum sp. 48-1-W]|nr:hypothetical protein [Halorubrum sp. 48-1-W]
MPTYDCADCDYAGDDYARVADGTTGGTAVCPECEGQLTIGGGSG